MVKLKLSEGVANERVEEVIGDGLVLLDGDVFGDSLRVALVTWMNSQRVAGRSRDEKNVKCQRCAGPRYTRPGCTNLRELGSLRRYGQ